MGCCEDILYGALKMYQPDDSEGLRVNVDTILLAHFAKPKKEEKILEIGCAHGAISLLLAKRGFSVTGIDIQPHLTEMAKKNAQLNSLDVEFLTADIKNYKSFAKPQSFDRIVVNPPYCEENASRKSPNSARAAAVNGAEMTLEDAVGASHYLLKNKGRLDIIMKAERTGELFALLDKYKTPPKVMRSVHPAPFAPASVVLIEAMRAGKHGLTLLPPLFICGEDGYETEELKKAYVLEVGV